MESLNKEFDRQKANFLSRGYADIAKMSTELFSQKLEALRYELHSLAVPDSGIERGRIPFVIVVKSDLVPAGIAMSFVEVKGKSGIVNMHPVEPASFQPIPSVRIPDQSLYLALDLDIGRESLNVTPADALVSIFSQDRSPLVIDEGVALVVHFPEVLQDKINFNAFSIPGSRRGDQRVPALWVSYGRPRLGWCWENNPHTWLGSASCGNRTAAAVKLA